MIEIFVKRPVTTIIFILFFMVMGLVSFLNLNVEQYPKVEFPLVTISVTYPGATPVEVEQQALKKVEDVISEVSEIKKMTTYAYENYGYVLVEFLLEADANIKSIEIKDKVDTIIADLPEGAERPVVKKFDPLAKPVMDLVLTSDKHSLKELYEYADKKLKTVLTGIPGVASATIYGGREREISIQVDPTLMMRYFLSINDVIDTISQYNKNIPGGMIEKELSSLSIRFLGEFQSLDDIRSLIITNAEGGKVRLDQIAQISDGSKELESMARLKGREVVDLSLIKVSDGNAVKISEKLRKDITHINSTLPEGMKLEVATDTSTLIQTENDNTISGIIIGIILTVVIMLLFTGKVSSTIVSSLVIPASIVSTYFLMERANFTINNMTLLALATSMGTLIANAIVIIESVLVRIENGEDNQSAAINGTKDVVVAVLASAGTNLVVFTPIAFMGGMVGKFMIQFGLTVVFATIFSIVASFSLTPMLCALLLRKSKNSIEQKKHKGFIIFRMVDYGVKFLLHEYKVLFNLMFRFPKTSILFVIGVFVYSMTAGGYLGGGFIPASDKNQIQFHVDVSQGSTIYQTENVVKQVEEIAKAIPEVTTVLSRIGGDKGVETAIVYADLVDSKARGRTDKEIINEILPKVALIPDATILMTRGDPSGGSNLGDIEVQVYGIDYEKMIAYNSQVVQAMKDSGFFRTVVPSYKKPKKEIRFIPNQDKMTEFGIPNVLIASTLRNSIYGNDKNVYKENGEEYDINIELMDDYKIGVEDLKKISVTTRKGLIPITELGRIEIKDSLPSIQRIDKQRVITIQGTISKSSVDETTAIMNKDYFSKIKFEKGYGIKYGGSADNQKESQQEILKAFILATVLTYMILAAILNSFVHPFTIVSTVLTSISGVILILFFSGLSFNIGSMLAVVMLVGLVVNNAILILDVTMSEIQKGRGIIESIWKGIEDKFKVVLMTSIAIIAGTFPQFIEPVVFKASMAAVIIGGMIASIFFTFFLIPQVFWYLERFSQFVRLRVKGK